MNELKVRKEIGAQGVDVRCPNCGMDMAAGAALCTQCGYEPKSGRTLTQKAATRRKLLRAAVLLLLAAAALYLGPRIYRHLTTAPPPPAKPDPSAVMEDLKARLDRNLPLAQPGSEVELRDQRGKMYRGRLDKVSGKSAVLQQADGSTITVELEALDDNSRLRLDPAARQQAVREKAGL